MASLTDAYDWSLKHKHANHTEISGMLRPISSDKTSDLLSQHNNAPEIATLYDVLWLTGNIKSRIQAMFFL